MHGGAAVFWVQVVACTKGLGQGRPMMSEDLKGGH